MMCFAVLLAVGNAAAFAPEGAQRGIGMVVPVDSAFVGGAPITPGLRSGVSSVSAHSAAPAASRRSFYRAAKDGGARMPEAKLRASRRSSTALRASNPDEVQNADVEVVGSEPAVFDPLGLGGGGSAGQDIDQVMQQQALWMAAKTGDLNGITQAVNAGADVNHKYTGEGMASAIQCAALVGNTEAVEKLASLGADVKQEDQYKWTALHDAALNGHTETVEKLLALGADINAQTDVEDEAPGAGLRTALSNAAMNGHTDTVRKLVSMGADVNCRQKDGWSSLHFAAKNGWEDTVAALVELGISPNVKNDVDMTPLHYAAWDATVETCQKLIDLGLSLHLNTPPMPTTPPRFAILGRLMCGAKLAGLRGRGRRDKRGARLGSGCGSLGVLVLTARERREERRGWCAAKLVCATGVGRSVCETACI
jgi:ankyrin repeat protein